MRSLLASFVAISLFVVQVPVFAADAPIGRRDGFLLIWNSIQRATADTREMPFTDVPSGSPGFQEITFAKARGLLDDDDAQFYPDSPLSRGEALLWMFRMRSLEPINDDGTVRFLEIAEAADVQLLAEKYNLSTDASPTVTQEELLNMLRSLDSALASEVHEVSLYSEKFHGKGTAFGETFDMNALTAAHRSFPHNTLAKVTNIANGKSVVVRVNDRGPFVQGRNMDLSLASFLEVSPREKGKINATIERLGDATLAKRCTDERFQRRIGGGVILDPGIPHLFALGGSLALSSKSFFFVKAVVYPDGQRTDIGQWIGPEGEVFGFEPSITGTYGFVLANKLGRVRNMQMEVVEC